MVRNYWPSCSGLCNEVKFCKEFDVQIQVKIFIKTNNEVYNLNHSVEFQFGEAFLHGKIQKNSLAQK